MQSWHNAINAAHRRAGGLSCVASRHVENVCVCAPYLLSRTKQSADSDDIRTAADAACTTTGEDKNGERAGGGTAAGNDGWRVTPLADGGTSSQARETV